MLLFNEAWEEEELVCKISPGLIEEWLQRARSMKFSPREQLVRLVKAVVRS